MPLERLAHNHPLPDGNKRTAFIATGLFLEANGRRFASADANVDVPLVERVAAGEADHAEIIEWLEIDHRAMNSRSAATSRVSDEIQVDLQGPSR